MENQKFYYDNKIVKLFILATIIWGVVAIIVGLLVAAQIAYPVFNFNLEFTTFGRTRPLHTNAVIFAFVGNAIFAGVYYSLQRLLKARLFSDVLSRIHFWGWQFIIVLAAVILAPSLSSAVNPIIDVWYGLNQEFGQIGRPQEWVNIVGNVSDPDGADITSLTYSLNGGPPLPLSIGRDNARLEKTGDFNAEIDADDLIPRWHGKDTELRSADLAGDHHRSVWRQRVDPPVAALRHVGRGPCRGTLRGYRIGPGKQPAADQEENEDQGSSNEESAHQ